MWRVQRKVANRHAEDVRSGMLDAATVVKVEARFRGCRDPKDNKLFDVLEQSDAMWLCSDDPDVHAVGREDVIGLGELVQMIEEVS